MNQIEKKHERISELVHYFVKRVPGAGRTQIVKFLYLTDLYSRQFLGEPLTDLEYIWWNHGPFDSQIYATISELTDSQIIKERKVQYPRTNGYQYTAIKEPSTSSFDHDELEIIKFVAKKYSSWTLNALLHHVYQTEPMTDAKKRNARGKKLRMNIIDNSRHELFDGIRKGVKQLDRGEGVPFSHVLSRSRARAS